MLRLRAAFAFMALVVQKSSGADRQKCWPSGCGVLSNPGVGTLAPLAQVPQKKTILIDGGGEASRKR